jgi:hypothetical protein
MQGKLLVGISGYDPDPRERYQIDEVHAFIRDLTNKVPWWICVLLRKTWDEFISPARLSKMVAHKDWPAFVAAEGTSTTGHMSLSSVRDAAARIIARYNWYIGTQLSILFHVVSITKTKCC